jgi:RHS protein
VLEPAGKFYIAPDHLGAPHQITDASVAVVWQWNHDPFGNGAPELRPKVGDGMKG